ncbi:HNH endonuclease [Leifsonia williamsii]|uniref:HNH endonuclease n=1 Tax=Leifsonia williamsii TaxID=3035919 RepID=UPI00341774E7
MPRAPRKCPTPGCENRITNQRYCYEHTPINWAYGTDRTNTPLHREWRAAVLQRCGGRCEIRGPKCTGKATEADHITPVAEGGTYTLSNGQGACTTCHAAKTKQEAARGRTRAFTGTPRTTTQRTSTQASTPHPRGPSTGR